MEKTYNNFIDELNDEYEYIVYDFELQRINAFVITKNGELSEGELHFDCFTKLLEGKKEIYSYENLFEYSDNELEELTIEEYEDFIIGEVAKIGGQKYIIQYDEIKNEKLIRQFYNYPIVILENGETIDKKYFN